ncbi:hypothetical protein ACQFX9_14300 [Aliinostoc sp. HNIBRCY26]|uniref:hypothetical protein n=1 Tax=Aliinostoc sp. HNIBRCY26 TaxID=3418997 RepID=UPI003CFCD758
MKDKVTQLVLALILLSSCLFVVSLGGTLPKNYGDMSLCNLKANQRGRIKGIVTSVVKEGSKAQVYLTEGKEGCQVLVYYRYSQLGIIQRDARVTIPVKVINSDTAEALGEPTFNPDVVDQNGNLPEHKTVIVEINQEPRDTYLAFRTKDENGMPFTESLALGKFQGRVGTGKYKVSYVGDRIVEMEKIVE